MMKKITNSNKAQKVFIPSLTTVFLGLEGILFALIAYAIPFQNKEIIGVSAMAMFEAFSLIIILLILGFKNIVSLVKKLKSKKGLFFIVGTVFGTSIGNLFLFLGIAFAGPSYGVVLTALFPIFSMILIKFFLKEKENWQVWFGVILTFIGSFLFLLFPIFINLNSQKFEYQKILGMVFGMLAALFWSFESLFFKKALIIKKGPSFNDVEINSARHIFSFLTTWVVLMPIMCFVGNTFKTFGELVINWKAVLVCLAIAINLVILRFMHVKTLKLVGPKITALFASNNFIVPSLLSYVLFLLPYGLDGKEVFEMMDWRALIILVPIVIGVWMTLYYNDDDEKQMQIH